MSETLFAFADETGDRGGTAKSSKFFAFATVLVAREDETALRSAVDVLRTEFTVPPGQALHWVKHVKTYPRRQFCASQLGSLPGLMVIYVVVEKATIPVGSAMRTDQVLFYNYAAGLALERIVQAANWWPGGARQVRVRFGHVRGFRHETTDAYFEKLRETRSLPWNLLPHKPTFDDQARWDGLQAADQYAGMLSAAIKPDEFGGYDANHLLAIRHQLRRSPSREAIGWGFKSLGPTATFTSLPWWPPTGL